jgi:hypothetical protein
MLNKKNELTSGHFVLRGSNTYHSWLDQLTSQTTRSFVFPATGRFYLYSRLPYSFKLDAAELWMRPRYGRLQQPSNVSLLCRDQ